MHPPIPPNGSPASFLDDLSEYHYSLAQYYKAEADKVRSAETRKARQAAHRQEAEKRLQGAREVFEGYRAAGLPYEAALRATKAATGATVEAIQLAASQASKQKKARLAVLAEAGLEGKTLADLTGYHPKAVKRALERVNHRQATGPRPRQPGEASREAPPASN